MTKAIAIYQHKCKRAACGHQWQSLNRRPVVCPRCKSYSWDKLIAVKKQKA